MSRGPNGMGGPASKGRGYSVGGPQQLVGPPPPPRRPITLHERVGEGSMRAGERKPEGPTPVKRRTLTPPRTLTVYDARPIGMDRPAADPPGAHDRREEVSSVGAGREGRLPARTASPRWGGRHHQSRRMRFVWGRRWGGVCAQSVAPKGGSRPSRCDSRALHQLFVVRRRLGGWVPFRGRPSRCLSPLWAAKTFYCGPKRGLACQARCWQVHHHRIRTVIKGRCMDDSGAHVNVPRRSNVP